MKSPENISPRNAGGAPSEGREGGRILTEGISPAPTGAARHLPRPSAGEELSNSDCEA